MRILILILLFAQFSFAAKQMEMTDQQFLELVAKKTFYYFWNEANPDNGLIPDATHNRNASISVTGFGLAAICIADARGWISHQEAYDRVLKTLQCFVEYQGNPSKVQVQAEHGHHYHWININTGAWSREEGIYATDTAAFIAGVLTVGSYFKGTEIEILADQIYENVDWTWFYNKNNNRIFVGWTPNKGHEGEYTMTEIGTLFTLLGIGSPTFPIPVKTWFGLGNTYYWAKYKEYRYVGDGAAYTHQWPFCFIDPRLKKDYYLDYFQNLREFSLASRQWCIDNKDQGYGEDIWGLNPSVGPGKYGEYAAPIIPNAPLPYNGRDNDGTVAPTAALSFMPFTPHESFSLARYIYNNYGNKIFGNYGFKDSFNIKKNFWASDYLGIDQGPIVIMIDNYLYGTVWKSFRRHKYVKQAMDKIGFVGILDNFDESKHSASYAKWSSQESGIKFIRDNSYYKEGKASLRIEFNKELEKNLIYLEPSLKDLSEYQYLGLWKSGDYNLKIIIEDESKKPNKNELNLLNLISDGNWDLVYYDLSDLKINLTKIKRIIFQIILKANLKESMIYFDDIYIANTILSQSPPALKKFEAKTGEHNGEVELTWDPVSFNVNQGNLVNYIIKKSDKPIVSKNDFAKAERILDDFIPELNLKPQKVTVSHLEPGKKYYFGIVSINNMNNTSEIMTDEALANGSKEKIFNFHTKELMEFNISEWKPVVSKEDLLQLSKVKGLEGEAIELNYIIRSSDNWHWVGINKSIQGILPKKSKFIFYLKGEGIPLNLEFKLRDTSGSIFGKKIENLEFNNEWKEIVIDSSELTYWWGGTGSKIIGSVNALEIAFSTDKRGKGKLAISKLMLK